jgi:hypothetical protein
VVKLNLFHFETATPLGLVPQPTARSALTTEQPKREASNETPVFLLRPRPDALHNGSRKGAAPFWAREFGGLERDRGCSWLRVSEGEIQAREPEPFAPD